ncbi:phosphatase PAP2 family protein [Vicingus serpentipes]|uniref:phosphatase PAP2 family protein n=1 Tax=Vicingus serpentipes TaxID=1926625 RepID=UPI001CB8B67A|nr:phosphatase PAP2 family protein [Vicingus serpentipes]
MLYIVPFIVTLIFLSDKISVYFFKEVFMRLRPCHNPEIANLVHIVSDHCGGQYGFVSSHATNTFALAVFVGLLVKQKISWLLPTLVIWAAVVSYSRIYLGVHYPGDVICGAILGAIIGKFVFMMLSFINKKIDNKIGL